MSLENPAAVFQPVEVKTGKTQLWPWLNQQAAVIPHHSDICRRSAYWPCSQTCNSDRLFCSSGLFTSHPSLTVVEPSTQSSDEQQLIKINPCRNATWDRQDSEQMSGRDREFIHMIDLNQSAFYWGRIFLLLSHTVVTSICVRTLTDLFPFPTPLSQL